VSEAAARANKSNNASEPFSASTLLQHDGFLLHRTGCPVIRSAVPTLTPMGNHIKDYDWGSSSALALLQSRTPSGGPEAELWMGAHPAAPSCLVLDNDGRISLPEAVARFPEAVLGPAVMARFGRRLPFLLKVLAIARPLSVQVHPDAERAREAYRPDGGSPYVDGFHKPEMLYALEPVEALFGFRTAPQVAMLLERLHCDRLSGLIEILTGPGTSETGAPADESERLHAVLSALIGWPVGDRAALVAEIATGSGRLQASGNTDYPEAFGWLARLVGLHPADPMVLAPLLLDLVRLSPGQTVFVPAGVPHCYLSGLGVEIMATSDNVLRAGLTGKPVDVDELLRVIVTQPFIPSSITPVPLGEHEVAWRPDVDEFQLTRITVCSAGEATDVVPDASISGPQVLLCTRGKVQVRTRDRSVQLISGFSAFVTAEAGPLTLSGDGDIFRAAAGLQVP
jgi:mannose-6-phosphate isomerase